jgi:hypothetical protein
MSYLQITIRPYAPFAASILVPIHIDPPTHIDELMEKVPNCSSSEEIAALFELERLSLLRQLPGKNFAKVWGDTLLKLVLPLKKIDL